MDLIGVFSPIPVDPKEQRRIELSMEVCANPLFVKNRLMMMANLIKRIYQLRGQDGATFKTG
jgi:hypothetical protein